jgi:hypothetical protein
MPRTSDGDGTDNDEHVRTRGYGSIHQNNSSIEASELEDVFENPALPRRREAISALTDAGLLSSLEAEAYVRCVIEEQSPVDEQPFSQSIVESAKRKLAAARESFSIIDTYRFPEAPNKCSKCGSALGDVWTTNLAERPLCLDCADVDRPELNS